MLKQYVLHISKWYPNKEDDLEGIFIQRHIQSISPKFNSIVLYARSSKSNSDQLYSITQNDHGSIHEFIGYYKKQITGITAVDRAIKTVLYFYILNRLLKLVIKSYGKPVILHAHVLTRSAIIAYWFSIKLKVPFVITEHSTFYTSNQRIPVYGIKNMIRRFVIKRAHAVITVSADLELGMKKVKLQNINYQRLYNCVNTKFYHYIERPINCVKKLLHISEFKNEHKNILGLLEVIKLLHQDSYQFDFHLAGYGGDLEVIQKYIETHQLSDCVHYHGKCKDEQLARLYSNADVFLLFSNKENMPCVIAESLCCGTPVISTNVGGIAEILNDTNGILVDKGNQDQLMEAILKILRNEKLFNRKQIAEDAIQLFSEESIGNQLMEIYSKCL